MMWFFRRMTLTASSIPVLCCIVAGLIALPQSADSAIVAGLLNDFEDGSTQNWSGNSAPTNFATGGPAGASDNFLRIGGGNRFAIFNSTSTHSGAIDPGVTAIQVDLMRPASDPTDLEMRLVLFGPQTFDRWTSANAETILADGVWRTYTFSLLEADLIRVLGADTYANLSADVDRIMFRHDPSPASATGISAPGTLGIDNVRAIPEPGATVLLLSGLLVFLQDRRRG